MSRKYIIKEVKQYFEDHNCELLETEYVNCKTKMKYKCFCGNSDCKITFDHFKRGIRCAKCGGNKKNIYEEAKQYFEDHGCELLEIEYINSYTPMRYKCECGNISEISFSNFKKGQRCKLCGIKKRCGENNHSYNPNKTDKEREKGRICPGLKKWKKDIYKKNNYTCQCCFKRGEILNAHHIESYDNNKELRTDIYNGITFCESCHKEFHKIYGYGHNNREQLNEFLGNISV